MAEVIWTDTALNDIDAIAEYISIDSQFYATEFVKKVLTASNELEKFAEIGKIVPELPSYDYREILFKRYRIIYLIKANIVYIISVHHSSRLLSSNENFANFFE